MSYFNKFPKVSYDVKGDGNLHYMTNITKNIRLVTDKYKQISGFDVYDVVDGDTPEMLAHKFYDSTTLHWIILITNNIINVQEDWPIHVRDFQDIIEDKYDDIDGIHHYEIAQESGDDSVIINVPVESLSEYPASTPITNTDHEIAVELTKRRIRILKPQFLSQFIEEFNAL